MEILHASANDAEVILSLQRAAYQSEATLHNDFNIPPLTQSLNELREDFKRKTILNRINGLRLD